MRSKTHIQFGKLAVALIASLAAGAIGSLFTFSAIPAWYATLAKPSFTPPNWLFGPVWTTLYVLMGIAFYLIWTYDAKKKDTKIKRYAIIAFIAQLVLNALWSILFFGIQIPWIAFAEIVVLWCAIIVTIYLFSRLKKAAAWLLVPYLLWVTFASALNLAIALLN